MKLKKEYPYKKNLKKKAIKRKWIKFEIK